MATTLRTSGTKLQLSPTRATGRKLGHIFDVPPRFTCCASFTTLPTFGERVWVCIGVLIIVATTEVCGQPRHHKHYQESYNESDYQHDPIYLPLGLLHFALMQQYPSMLRKMGIQFKQSHFGAKTQPDSTLRVRPLFIVSISLAPCPADGILLCKLPHVLSVNSVAYAWLDGSSGGIRSGRHKAWAIICLQLDWRCLLFAKRQLR